MITKTSYTKILCAALPSLLLMSNTFATQRKIDKSPITGNMEVSECRLNLKTQSVPITLASSKLTSPDGKWNIHIGEEMSITSSDEKIQKKLGDGYSLSTSFSPQKTPNSTTLLAVGKYDGSVSVFNLKKNDINQLTSFKACQNEVFSTALSANLELLVQCGTKEIVAYKIGTSTPTPLAIKHTQPGEFITSIAISPSGKYFSIGDKLGELRMYEMEDNQYKNIQKVLVSSSAPAHLVFTPDETALIYVPAQSHQMITAYKPQQLGTFKNLYYRPDTYSYTVNFGSNNTMIGYGIGSSNQGLSTFNQTIDYQNIINCFPR